MEPCTKSYELARLALGAEDLFIKRKYREKPIMAELKSMSSSGRDKDEAFDSLGNEIVKYGLDNHYSTFFNGNIFYKGVETIVQASTEVLFLEDSFEEFEKWKLKNKGESPESFFRRMIENKKITPVYHD